MMNMELVFNCVTALLTIMFAWFVLQEGGAPDLETVRMDN